MKNMRVIIFLFSVLCSLHQAAAKGLPGEGEEDEIRSIAKDATGASAFQMAMSTKSDSVASAAFGSFIKGSAKMPAGEVAKRIQQFSQRSQMYSRAVGLASYHTNFAEVLDAVMALKDYPLAASMIHFRAKNHFVNEQIAAKQLRMKGFFTEEIPLGGKATQKREGQRGSWSQRAEGAS